MRASGEAAELVERFPDVEAALRDGRLCLSSVIEVAKVITRENAAEVLPRFFGLSSRDAAQVAVSIRPVENPPQRDVVTPLRTAAPEASARATEPPLPATVTDESPKRRPREMFERRPRRRRLVRRSRRSPRSSRSGRSSHAST